MVDEQSKTELAPETTPEPPAVDESETTSASSRMEFRVPRRGLGIRTRLALLTMGVVLIVMGIAGTLLLNTQRQAALEESVDRAAALLGTLAVPCGISVATGALEQLDGYLAEVAEAGGRHMGLVGVVMMDHKGTVLGSAGEAKRLDNSFLNKAAKSPESLWQRGRDDSGVLVLQVSMPAVSGLRWGTLIGMFDLGPLEDRMALSQKLFIGAGIAFMLAMLGVLFFGLSRIVVAPVQRLSLAAAALEKGDWSARAEVTSGDELGRATGAFNAMASELQSYTENLERKVEKRALEVRAKNVELQKVNERLTQAVDALEQLVITDPLTGIYNRRYFAEVLNFEFQRSTRAKHPMSLIMLDVDHFGDFNNRFGHQAGDGVLCHVSQVLVENIRGIDILARYGGEEFVVLLLDTPAKQGLKVAENLRAAVESFSFPVGDDLPLARVTMSVGVAGYPDDAEDANLLVKRADMAMYAAKRSGRNRVEVWHDSMAEIQP